MRLNKIPVVFLGAALLLFRAGCASQGKEAGESNQLKIGSLPIEDNPPLLVAEKKVILPEENLDFALIPFQSPVESQSAFQSGELDGMVTDMLIAAMLKAPESA